LADSVLSRGISRHQYFLGKWHARLTAILGAFGLMGLVFLVSSLLLLHEDVSLSGGLIALGTVAALLATVITCGVAGSAACNSTVLGIALLWIVLYGSGFLLSLLPTHIPSPDRALATLPFLLRGHYDPQALTRLLACAGAVSAAAAVAGLV